MARAQHSRIQAFECNKMLQKKEHGGVAGNSTNARLQGQVRAFEGFKANRYILMKVPAVRDKVISKKSIPLKHIFTKRGVPNGTCSKSESINLRDGTDKQFGRRGPRLLLSKQNRLPWEVHSSCAATWRSAVGAPGWTGGLHWFLLIFTFFFEVSRIYSQLF